MHKTINKLIGYTLMGVLGVGVAAGCEYCQPLLLAAAAWMAFRQLQQVSMQVRHLPV